MSTAVDNFQAILSLYEQTQDPEAVNRYVSELPDDERRELMDLVDEQTKRIERALVVFANDVRQKIEKILDG